MSNYIPTPPINLYIADITDGKMSKEGEEDSYRWALITANGETVFRLRINGTILDSYFSSGEEGKKAFCALTVDDGTDTIQLKGWEETAEYMNKFTSGNEVEVFGKPRKGEDEIYILPEEIVQIEDHNQELYLRLKKIKRYTKKNFHLPTQQVVSQMHNMNEKDLVWGIIPETLADEGISFDEILEKTGLSWAKIESIIQELSKNGDIYEPSPMKYKKI